MSRPTQPRSAAACKYDALHPPRAQRSMARVSPRRPWLRQNIYEPAGNQPTDTTSNIFGDLLAPAGSSFNGITVACKEPSSVKGAVYAPPALHVCRAISSRRHALLWRISERCRSEKPTIPKGLQATVIDGARTHEVSRGHQVPAPAGNWPRKFFGPRPGHSLAWSKERTNPRRRIGSLPAPC